METNEIYFMDISFIAANNRIHIKAESIHGMLWLQTHFESTHWEALALDQVLLSNSDAEMLSTDATKAGLTINSVPSITYSKKYQTKPN